MFTIVVKNGASFNIFSISFCKFFVTVLLSLHNKLLSESLCISKVVKTPKNLMKCNFLYLLESLTITR